MTIRAVALALLALLAAGLLFAFYGETPGESEQPEPATPGRITPDQLRERVGRGEGAGDTGVGHAPAADEAATGRAVEGPQPRKKVGTRAPVGRR